MRQARSILRLPQNKSARHAGHGNGIYGVVWRCRGTRLAVRHQRNFAATMTVVPDTCLTRGTCMGLAALALVGVLGLLGAAASARAAPAIPNLGPEQDPNIIRVWGGCGCGFHPNT